jgi:hypothetical protein
MEVDMGRSGLITDMQGGSPVSELEQCANMVYVRTSPVQCSFKYQIALLVTQ